MRLNFLWECGPMFKKTILILSANSKLVSEFRNFLLKEDIEVTCIRDIASAMKKIPEANFTLIILDSPDLTGEGVRLCREIHKMTTVPILLLVNGDESERIKGLDAGADKCLSRPIDVPELIANVHAVFRRTGKSVITHVREQKPIAINNLLIDEDNHLVKLDKKTIELTAKEFGLLLILAQNKGRILSRQNLIKQVWGDEPLESHRTIDVHICRLRKKIEPDTVRPTRLVSIRGFGYKLEQ